MKLATETVEKNLPTTASERGLFPIIGKAAGDISLRFVLVYLFLESWIWLDELVVNPTRPIRPVFNAIFGGLARWFGRHIFHLSGPIESKKLHDSVYMYLVLFSVLVVSALVTIIWLAWDRRGRTVGRAYGLMRIWIRFGLAYMVLIYALDKVFRIQFTAPGPMRLIESYGESSPMALMWTFVGYSGFFTVFSGVAEVSGSLLLFFRRTTPMGALVLTVLMTNVALMDFCYDVSVKMLALHFLLMSIFLLAHDTTRLLNVLALNRPAPADESGSLLWSGASRRARYLVLALKVLIVLYTIVPGPIRTYGAFKVMGPYAPQPPLYGLYEVTSFKANGAERPLLVNDSRLWRYLAVENSSQVFVKTMDNTVLTYDAKYDPIDHEIRMRRSDSGSPPEDLLISVLPNGGLSVTGQSGNNQVAVLLHSVDLSKFPLVSRGYHWVNEKSYWK